MKSEQEIRVLLNELRGVEKLQEEALHKAIESNKSKLIPQLAYSFVVTGKSADLLDWVLEESNYQANE